MSPRLFKWADDTFQAELENDFPVLSSSWEHRANIDAFRELPEDQRLPLARELARDFLTSPSPEAVERVRVFRDRIRALAWAGAEALVGGKKSLPSRQVKAIVMPRLETLLGRKHVSGDEGAREWSTKIGSIEVTTSVEIRQMPHCSFRYWHSYPSVGEWNGFGDVSILFAWGLEMETTFTSFSEEECERQVDVLCSVVKSFLDARPWEAPEPNP